jgi:hypothetical protein
MKWRPFIPPRFTAVCVIVAIAAAIGVSLVRNISQHEQIDRLQAVVAIAAAIGRCNLEKRCRDGRK